MVGSMVMGEIWYENDLGMLWEYVTWAGVWLRRVCFVWAFEFFFCGAALQTLCPKLFLFCSAAPVATSQGGYDMQGPAKRPINAPAIRPGIEVMLCITRRLCAMFAA